MIVGVGLRGVLFGFFRGGMRETAVAAGVGLAGFGGEVLVLALFLAREGAEAVVFLFGGGGGWAVVVEGGAAEVLGVVGGHVGWIGVRMGIYMFFFSNVVRIYVFKRREWRRGNGIYTLDVCTYKSVFKWYTTNLFCWTCSGVCNQKWLGLAKSWLHAQRLKSIPAKPIASFHMPNPVTFCFPFHFTFNNTIPSESSLARIQNLSDLLLGRYPSSGRLLLSTLSAHQTFSMSAHWHKTSTREKKVNTARNLKKLDIAAAKDLLCKVSQILPRGTGHAMSSW